MKSRIQLATGIIIALTGFLLTVIAAYLHAKASGASFDWALALLGVGASVAASGIVIFVQIFFLGDPFGRIEVNLQNALENRLPSGVTNLFLRVGNAPRYETLFKNAKVVRFFGPEGSSILSCISDEAHKRDKKNPIRLEMFIAKFQSNVADNVGRSDFKTHSSQWNEALEKANDLQGQGKLNFAIHELDLEPTVSAIEVDECYYQVTMLFPRVGNEKRPTMSMHPSVAREDYFDPLWAYLRLRATTSRQQV